MFPAAAAQRTRTMRLVPGVVLLVFNNPLKLAGELGMLDAISNGRLDIGVAHAFLPHEFAAFGVSMDESRERFEEGFAALRVLLSTENASFSGQFHHFHNITSLSRPVQQPHPPFWIAALTTEESFYKAGINGYHLMAIPMEGAMMRPLLQTYRQAYRTADHPGQGKVMLAFHMYCASTDREAHDTARPLLNAYLQGLVTAVSEWDTTTSKDYKDYPEMIARLKRQNFEGLVASGGAWVRSPQTIKDIIRRFINEVDGFDSTSLQVMNGATSEADAGRSIRLFADHVMPAFP